MPLYGFVAGTAAASVLVLALPTEVQGLAWIGLALGLVAVCGYAAISQTSRILGDCVTRGPDRPQVALTFDDGPGMPGTEVLLDLLGEYQVPATFFLVGENVAAQPELTRRIQAEGHLIGNHSSCHRPWLTFAPIKALTRDLERCQDAIEAATGERPRFFRPPYGLRSHATQPAARSLGLTVVGWDCGGFDTTRRSVDSLAGRLRDRLRPGSIVLLHDHVPDPERTLRLVREVLDECGRRGLEAVRLDVLLGD